MHKKKIKHCPYCLEKISQHQDVCMDCFFADKKSMAQALSELSSAVHVLWNAIVMNVGNFIFRKNNVQK